MLQLLVENSFFSTTSFVIQSIISNDVRENVSVSNETLVCTDKSQEIKKNKALYYACDSNILQLRE